MTDHNADKCIELLSKAKPRGKDDREAIEASIACLKRLQETVLRQRKQLTDLQAKLAKKVTP